MLRALLLGLLLSFPAAAGERPVVVELFTSQGCSSCPPADAYLAELARRDDALALSLHVDYWNYIGWKDPFSSLWATERQREYGRTLAQRYVYTPEMVVDGAAHAVGSNRAEVEGLIAAARRQEGPLLTLAREGEALRVSIGAGAGPGTLLLVRFEREHVTKIARGENGGRTLRNVHVVREIRRLGEWEGTPLAVELPAPQGDAAILLQAAGHGRMLAAAKVQAR
jgi:hypothetical protein